ncbi:MAG: DUF2779 domain-containing protein [Chthonomonas sp.]|nr:DUF2779 domain-containing protein [Chthonomonas sp.]
MFVLNKRLYMIAQDCARKVHYATYHRELQRPPDASLQQRFAEGREVGMVARRLFPGGIEAMRVDRDMEAGMARCFELMEQRVPLFEATFVHDRRMARVDILEPVEGGWRIVEVKSAGYDVEKAEVKGTATVDITFQYEVLRRAGVPVVGCDLLMFDKAYVYPGGEHRLEDLFVRVDVTGLAEERGPELWDRSDEVLDILADAEMPAAELKPACKECDFREHCVGEIPIDSILFLPGLTASKFKRFQDCGKSSITQLSEVEVTPTQKLAWGVFQTGEGFNSPNLTRRLAEIEYPAVCVDFEAAKWAIPRLQNTRPNQQVSVQFSAHRLDSEDAIPVHSEFLWREPGDPREPFASALLAAVEGSKTRVVYNLTFERSQIQDLARDHVAGASALLPYFESGVVDLLAIVRECIYRPGFRGNVRLKTVIGTLIPELGYGDLEIRDGGTAQAMYAELMLPETPPEVADDIAANLLEYCKRDTEALIALIRELQRIANY